MTVEEIMAEAVRIYNNISPVVEWLDIIFIGLVLIGCLLLNRWKHLVWLKVFMVYEFAGWTIYELFFHGSYPAYVLFRYIQYIVMAGAVYDILKRDFKKLQLWVAPAIFYVLVHATFLPPNGEPWFYLPRIAIFTGLAFQTSRAMRSRHLPLLTFSFIGIATLTCDLFKLFRPGLVIYKFQLILEPWINIVAAFILLVGVFQPYLKTAFIKLIESFPALRKKLALEPTSSSALSVTISGMKSEFDKLDSYFQHKLNVLNSALKDAPKALERSKRVFVTRSELEKHLSMSTPEVEKFIEELDIQKVYLGPYGEDDWAILRIDLNKFKQQ